MPGTFHGIETSSRALRAFQRSLDTTGHNIANVNTRGYSRQVADLVTSDPLDYLNGKMISLGTGVSVSQITQIRDGFLDTRMRRANSDLGRYTAQDQGARQVESVFLDADGQGISNAMDKFFNAWSGLASNPSELSARMQVQRMGSDLASRVRGAYAGLQALQSQQNGLVTQTFTQIQDLANRIGSLNKEIRILSAAGGSPNDLMDSRNIALSDLSKLMDIQTSTFSDGTTAVYMNGFTLVDPAGARTMPSNFDPVTQTVSDANGTYPIRSGALKGLFDNINSISSYQGQLDTLANNLRTQINNLHMTGTNSAGNTGVRFFNDVTVPPQTGASNFDLDPAIAADPNAIVSGISAGADGSIALGISRLRDTQIAALGNQTIGGYFSSVLAGVGRGVQAAQAGLDTQNAVVKQVEKQIADVSGVSLDDEMGNMLRFQRSYQASAKMLSIFDETIQDLIGMLKR